MKKLGRWLSVGLERSILRNPKVQSRLEEHIGLSISQYEGYLGISYCTNEEFPALSMCQLTKIPASLYDDIFTIPIGSVTYEFNRIKVGFNREGKGDGTILMKTLVELADKQKFYIVGSINPYGKLSYDDLKKWYAKYGFEILPTGEMIRVPK